MSDQQIKNIVETLTRNTDRKLAELLRSVLTESLATDYHRAWVDDDGQLDECLMIGATRVPAELDEDGEECTLEYFTGGEELLIRSADGGSLPNDEDALRFLLVQAGIEAIAKRFEEGPRWDRDVSPESLRAVLVELQQFMPSEPLTQESLDAREGTLLDLVNDLVRQAGLDGVPVATLRPGRNPVHAAYEKVLRAQRSVDKAYEDWGTPHPSEDKDGVYLLHPKFYPKGHRLLSEFEEKIEAFKQAIAASEEASELYRQRTGRKWKNRW